MRNKKIVISGLFFLVLSLFLIPLVSAESVLINPTGCSDSGGNCTLGNIQTQDGTEESQVGHNNAWRYIRANHDNSSAMNSPDNIVNVTVYIDRYESANPGGQTIQIEVTKASTGTSTTCNLNAKTAEDNVYDACDLTSFVTTESDAESLNITYKIQAFGNANYMYLDHAYVNITYNDTSGPAIALGNPVNNSWSNSTNVTFYFTPNDVTSGIANCSLITNGASNQSNTSAIAEGQENNITANLSEGTYTWTVNCTDNSQNKNIGTNISLKTINVDAAKPHNVSLNLPVNNYNTTSRNLTFNFTAYDNLASTLNCSLYFNGTLNQTNNSVVNGTLTNFRVDNIAEGRYIWNISCADLAGNINWSSSRNFTIDLSAPEILNLSFTPSSAEDIDPNVQLNISVNATDATVIGTIIFQYKSPSASTYTNITMTFNSTTNLYNASFTPNASGNWSYQVWRNDTLGNANTTTAINLSVEYDWSWTRAPAAWSQVACVILNTCTLGNLTVNNTGDYSLNFDLSHTPASITVSYNETEPFSLVAKEVKGVQISATAPETIYEYGLVITINPTDTNAVPDSLTSNVSFAVYSGGPYFDLTLNSYPTSALQSGSYNLSAKLRNIGNETAQNVWINYTLPAGFTNTSGNASQNIGNLSAGGTAWNNITITIASTVSPATYTIDIVANGTGNSGNASDSASGTTTVTCSNTDGICGTGCTSSTDTDCAEVPTPASSPGGGGGGGGTSTSKFSTQTITGKELLESKEAFELVRGYTDSFSVEITNPYAELNLENVIVKVEGYLSQYLEISPAYFDQIKPNETKLFTAKITSPTYMTKGTYDLKFTLKGKLYGEKITPLTGTSSLTTKYDKEFEEIRTIILTIFEVSKEDASGYSEQVKADFAEIETAGFPTKRLSLLLEEVQKAFAEKNYERVKEISEEIEEIKKNSFEADGLIKEIKERLNQAENKGLKTEETKKILALATAAFEREDYLTALARAKDAQLSYVIETKGKINILYFVKDWWWAILSVLIAFTIIGMIVHKELALKIITRKLEDLDKEEITLNQLVKEAQQKTFDKKTMSTAEYHKQMYNYEKRLSEIRQLKTTLRAKQVGIIRIEEAIKRLEREDQKIIESFKQLQDAYYNRQKITKKSYERRIEELKLRRTEIEKALMILEIKLGKKKRWGEVLDKEKKNGLDKDIKRLEKHGFRTNKK